MFTAINTKTNETVFIGDVENQNINSLRQMELVDPIYYNEVYPRRGHYRDSFHVRPHFVSKAVNELTELPKDVIFDPEYIKQRPNGYYRVGESFEHIKGKEVIAQWMLENVFPELENKKIVYEHRVYIPSKQKYRIIDVAMIFPCGILLAFECQLSPITINDLNERFYDYHAAGADSYWFFGQHAYNDTIAHFFQERTGNKPYILDIFPYSTK